MSFQPKHIFVPVAAAPGDDLSLAEVLVDAACDLVQGRAGARLTLAHVSTRRGMVTGADTGFVPPSYYEAMADLWDAQRKAASDALAQLQKRAEVKGIAATSTIIDAVEGTGEAIAHAAHDAHADLIALLSHGRRGIKRLFLGSVAERVAHVATVPVLILRPPA